ncbi:CYTH domain-containing protein [Alteromonadaceae bacterium BrNp21-10]|nr:CYTH domain-containing protein [Alteromonadaceae bacterium BrNp21-10]
MDTEIELKLLVSAEAGNLLEHSFIPTLDAQIKASRFKLFNCYYDTPDNALRAMDMGFRVRGRDGQYEQTIKTSGNSVGGLHQRPEYNIAIDNNQPDLMLFDAVIWPDSTDVESLQGVISEVFTTHFERSAYLLEFANGDKVEVVFDNGVISVGEHQVPLSEIEMELIQGKPERLFQLAQQLGQFVDYRLGILSKAARGYMLAKGTEIMPLGPLENVSLNSQFNIEQAFNKAIGYGLGRWQHSEQCFVVTGKIRALEGIYSGIALTIQALNLYKQWLACDAIDELLPRLQQQLQQWQWVHDVLSLKSLRSERGSFCKRLTKIPELLSYLLGREQGLMQQHQPLTIINAADNTDIQLSLTRLLIDMPWRLTAQVWENTILPLSEGVLASGWQSVVDCMQGEESLSTEQYLASEATIKTSLFNGVFLADLYGESTNAAFRAPWLDIMDGIEEVHTIRLLQSELQYVELPDDLGLEQWCQEKAQRIVDIMDQSRRRALLSAPYW